MTKKMSIFRWFYKGWRKKYCCGSRTVMRLTSALQSQQHFFANLYKTNEILTILRGRRGGRWRLNFTGPQFRQNPFSASTVWGKTFKPRKSSKKLFL